MDALEGIRKLVKKSRDKCQYCRNESVFLRFIKNTREYLCDSRECDLKSRIRYGLFIDQKAIK